MRNLLRMGVALTPERSSFPPACLTFSKPNVKSQPIRLDAVLEHGIIGCIGLLLFASVAFMGCRYDWGWLAWGQCVLLNVAALATALWLLRLLLRPEFGLVWSWSLILLAAGGLVGALQLISAPQALLEPCSPGIAPLLTPGTSNLAFERWPCASLAPARTADSLHYFALYCLTFFLVIQNVRTLEAVRKVLYLIFALGVALAFFGIVQYLWWNGKFYWCFEIPWVPPTNVFRGPFTNKNHFAGFLAMVVGPGCYCLLSMMGLLKTRRTFAFGIRDYLIPLGCFAFGCILAAAFLSASRGGIIATTVSFALASAGLTCFTHSKKLWLLLACLTCLGFGVLLGIAGTEQIEARLATLGLGQAMAAETPEARFELWGAILRAIPDFPVLGTGFGTHEYVYPLYLDKWYPAHFTHAENSYLQLLLEGGAATAVLVLSAIGAVCWWCVASLRGSKQPEAKACTVAVAAGLCASAVHASVDFVWYIPSHALMLAVLAGLALTLARAQRTAKVLQFPVLPRCGVLAGAAGLSVLFYSWIPMSFHHAQAGLHWTEFQRSVSSQDAAVASGDAVHVDLDALHAAIGNWPDHPMYAAALAECYRQQFERSAAWREASMPISQLRAAVENSQFDSRESRDRWLERAYGRDNRILLSQAHEQFRRVVRLCPLNSYAYLRLAELHFMCGANDPPVSELLQQAVKCRPYDPEIAYQAGVDFISQGDLLQGMECWRRSASFSEIHKQVIVAQLMPIVPLEQLVDQFRPDYTSLMALVRERFVTKEERKTRVYLLTKAKEATLLEVAPEIVGVRMRELHYAFLADAETEKAGQCARVAAAAEPDTVSTRLILIRWLIQQESFKEAKQELDWCILRASDNAEVRALRASVFDSLSDYRSQKKRTLRPAVTN